MDSDSHSTAAAPIAGGGDRLSKLGDATLGHILSFLPADEAACAAALSRRFRHVFAHVHTVSLSEPPEPDPTSSDSDDSSDDCYSPGYGRPRRRTAADLEEAVLASRRFVNRVSAALLTRLRLAVVDNGGGGGGSTSAGTPLRALRVQFEAFSSRANAAALDMWLWHAMLQQQQHTRGGGDGGGEGELEIHVDLGRRRRRRGQGPAQVVCDRRYSLLRRVQSPPSPAPAPVNDAFRHRRPRSKEEDDDGDDVYVAPRSVLTCAALRTLRLASCRLDLPPPPPPSSSAAGIALLPSLETMHLTEVTTGENDAMERLVGGCPRLAALTLESCAGVTALTASPCARLRALAIRCCHDLAAVAVADASELRSFHYRGAVPAAAGPPSFLTLRHGNGGGGDGPVTTISSCTLDFCGVEVEERMVVDNGGGDGDTVMAAVQQQQQQGGGLGDMLLQVLVGVERLSITSARLGCRVASLVTFPALANLRHLELTGMLPSQDDDGDDGATAMNSVVRFLEHAPNLETLTLFFMPEYYYLDGDDDDEEEDGSGHRLKYDECAPLAVPEGVELPCLRETMKEINFVHYQGGVAQRTLAKFLLCNAPGVREVCAEFASGPLFVQVKLMEEIKGWVMNKSANVMFF